MNEIAQLVYVFAMAFIIGFSTKRMAYLARGNE